jgi:hypothetical protein
MPKKPGPRRLPPRSVLAASYVGRLERVAASSAVEAAEFVYRRRFCGWTGVVGPNLRNEPTFVEAIPLITAKVDAELRLEVGRPRQKLPGV